MNDGLPTDLGVLDTAAISLHELYAALRRAGFSRRMARELLKAAMVAYLSSAPREGT